MNSRFLPIVSLTILLGSLTPGPAAAQDNAAPRPNILFILSDDQRYDALGLQNTLIHTPNLDRLAQEGVRFTDAFVTQSLCTPSRATCLTGRYGSANGVVGLGAGLKRGERTFPEDLKDAGYRTGFVGKWHLKDSPWQCGFDSVVMLRGNGPHYNRRVVVQNRWDEVPEYIEEFVADRSIDFLTQAAAQEAPFFLWLCTQVPHVDVDWTWPVKDTTLDLYDPAEMPLPASLNADLTFKPSYFKYTTNRNRALEHGFQDEAGLRENYRRYFAAVTEMDHEIGRVLASLDDLGLADDTWVVFLGDNGWLMGEHGLTNKLLPYEPSIRVPFIVRGPGLSPRVDDAMVLNLDVAPTILELAGLPVPDAVQGQSVVPRLADPNTPWRTSFYYESPLAILSCQPLDAVRTRRWKYIRTFNPRTKRVDFEELYDLQNDPDEMKNLYFDGASLDTLDVMREELLRLRGPARHGG